MIESNSMVTQFTLVGQYKIHHSTHFVHQEKKSSSSPVKMMH
jgi:hypothetical protein